MGDHHTTVGEDELNVAKAQAEEVIQPHCVVGDMARKAVAAIQGGFQVISAASSADPHASCSSFGDAVRRLQGRDRTCVS